MCQKATDSGRAPRPNLRFAPVASRLLFTALCSRRLRRHRRVCFPFLPGLASIKDGTEWSWLFGLLHRHRVGNPEIHARSGVSPSACSYNLTLTDTNHQIFVPVAGF